MFLFTLFLAPLVCPWMIWAVNPVVVARQGKATMQASSALNPASVYSVLLTALPSSILNLAQTNGPAVSSIIQSDLANGKTPGWFTALPKDIQTYFVPATATATSTPDATLSNPEPTIEVPPTTATTPQTTSTPAPAPASKPPPSAGLSTGAKVGIGIGVPVAVAAIAAVAGAYLLGVRRGRRRDVDPTEGAKVLDPSDELNASLSSRATDETMPSGAELPTAANVVELPANGIALSSLPPAPLGKDARAVLARPASEHSEDSGPHELPG